MQVRSACAAFHIEDTHGMVCVFFENGPVAFEVFGKMIVNIRVLLCRRRCPIRVTFSFAIILLKDRAKRCLNTVHHDLTRGIVDASWQGTVDTSKIDDQFSVHIEPEVIVTGKFVDDIMSPGVQSARRLSKRSLDLHREVDVHRLAITLKRVQLFTLTGIAVGKFRIVCRVRNYRGVQVIFIDTGVHSRLNIVVREELTVLQ